jgi:MFS family permease
MKKRLQATPLQKSLIYYLSIIGFFGIFSTTISKSPVLPLFAKALGSTDALIGLIAAFSPLAGILFSFPIGMLSDRIGPKKLLVISAIVFVSAPILYIFINHPLLLIPIRLFHGIATAILGPVASAMILKAYTKDKGEKLGIYSSATLIGRTLAPLLGGAIITYFAYTQGLLNYRLVYVAAALLSIPVLILVLMIKEEEQPVKLKGGITPMLFYTELKDLIGQRKMLATAFVDMAIYFAYGAFETYLPLYLLSKNFPAYQIGVLFSIQIISIALSKPVFGKISDNIDRRIQIIMGLSTVGVAMALIPLFTGFIEIGAVNLLFGLGMSFATVATSTYVADIAKKEQIGASIGALSSIMDIGQSSGPFITGLIIVSLSYEWGFVASTALCLLVCAFFFYSTYSRNLTAKAHAR